jgi:hypothetical protein
VEYTPASGFAGTDVFFIKVSDGKNISTSQVKLNIVNPNVIPSSIVAINGKDVYETAVKISKLGWLKSDYVIIAVGDSYADALAAVPLAKKYSAPILLTKSNELPKYTRDELIRLYSKHVFIIGREVAVSNKVQKEIEKLLKVKAVRLGGADHYETSAKIAAQIKYFNDIIIVSKGKNTTGMAYIDSLQIAPIAAASGTPILYIDEKNGAKQIKDFLKKAKINNIYLLNGGKTADKKLIELVRGITNKMPITITTKDIETTNINVIKSLENTRKYDNRNVIIIGGFSASNMKGMGNSLTAAALAAKLNSIVILSDAKLSKETEQYIKGIVTMNTRYIVIGGESLIPSSFLKSK